MTKEVNDQLDNEFGITKDEPVEVEVVKNELKGIKKAAGEVTKDTDKDYKYMRAQLYDIVEKMQESLNDAMDVAHDSQHPRAYEVVFNGAKNAADVVEKIGDLHKKMKDLEVEEVKVQQHNTTTNNIMMTGSTAELIQMLKESNKKEG